MAKTPERGRKGRQNRKSPIKQSNSRGVNSSKRANSRIEKSKISNGHISDEEQEIVVVPSSSGETENFEAEVSVEEVEEDPPSVRRNVKEGKEEVTKKMKSYKRKGNQEDVKSKGKKSKDKEEDEDIVEESQNTLYKFPMSRISRIVKSEHSDVRISQEAIFIINRASEKFLELFSKEAYARASIEHKSFVTYNHLSSVVSKRKRFAFVSDFIPEKVKAEVALARISETDK